MSRSPAFVVAYIIFKYKISIEKAIILVKITRPKI